MKRLMSLQTGGEDGWSRAQQLPDVLIHRREMSDESTWSTSTADDG